jgi:hypothetical protein
MSVMPEARKVSGHMSVVPKARDMSAVDERDLSVRLSGVLEAITPSPAPVGVALRSGKLIRARRNIVITAGLAVAAALMVAMPGLLHHHAHPGVSPVRPTVMVRPLCPAGRHGTVGSARQPESVTGRAGELPAAELVAGRAGGLPAAELAVGGCAWLMP